MDSPSLSDAAATLLRELIEDSQGTLLRTDYAEGIELHVNDKQLIENQDVRSIARWDEAIDELESRGLIRDTMKLDNHCTEYKLTTAGFHLDDARPDIDASGTEELHLGDEARTLLVEAATDPRGIVMRVHHLGGLSVQTNGKQLLENSNPRSEARWEAAIRELEQLGFIEDNGYKGEIYRVTNEGYRAADLLRGGN